MAARVAAVARLVRHEPCHLDDLPCLLDDVDAGKLTRALLATAPRRRIPVAMAFVGLESATALVQAADLAPTYPCERLTSMRTSMSRWLSHEHAMPMGVGFRLAKVFGVRPDLLCEGYS